MHNVSRLSFTRRTFLKASAVAALGLGILKSPFVKAQTTPPVSEQVKAEVVADKTVVTSCLNCSTRCGTVVRVANGKAVHIRGNPSSRVSEGEICPRGMIGLQVLYDPGRTAGPLKRTNPEKGKGIDPRWAPISWDEAIGEVSSHLRSLREGGRPHSLVLFEGLNPVSDEDLLRRFAQAYGTPNLITTESLEKQAEVTGRWMADGEDSHVAYDIGQTNYILAFGAGILESEKPVTRNLRMWGKIRRERPNRARVIVVDPRYSVTAARADRWLPVVPGTDGALAMSIANVIISESLYDADFVDNRTTGFDEYRQLVLGDYSPEQVAPITGIDADTIRTIAREFARARPAIAWIGRGVAAWPGGSYHSYAVFCLNALVGSIDVPGGVIYQQIPQYREMPEVGTDAVSQSGLAQPRIDLGGTSSFPAAGMVTNQVADSILGGNPYPVEMAIGFGSNFNMLAPANQRWVEAMKRIPYYVHVSPTVTEMAEFADVVLPCPTFMEQWGYDHSPPGAGFAELRVKQPVVDPLHDVRSTADILFRLAGDLGGTVAGSFSAIGNDGRSFAQFRTAPLVDWSQLLRDGVWTGPEYAYDREGRRFDTPSGKFEFRSGNLEALLTQKGRPAGNASAYLPHYEAPQFLGEAATYPLILSVYEPLLNVENGSQNYPWAQEQYLVMHGTGWTTFAEMNSLTAGELRVRDGDMVWVESPSGKIKVRARVFEGLRPGVVSIATGQGHYAGGQWQKGIGANPNDIIGVSFDALSGQSGFFNTRVRVYRV